MAHGSFYTRYQIGTVYSSQEIKYFLFYFLKLYGLTKEIKIKFIVTLKSVKSTSVIGVKSCYLSI